MGVNHPSIESSDLTTARNIVPHTTLSTREKARRVCDEGARCEGRKKKKKRKKNFGK
jgi:hypothetical protein